MTASQNFHKTPSKSSPSWSEATAVRRIASDYTQPRAELLLKLTAEETDTACPFAVQVHLKEPTLRPLHSQNNNFSSTNIIYLDTASPTWPRHIYLFQRYSSLACSSLTPADKNTPLQHRPQKRVHPCLGDRAERRCPQSRCSQHQRNAKKSPLSPLNRPKTDHASRTRYLKYRV